MEVKPNPISSVRRESCDLNIDDSRYHSGSMNSSFTSEGYQEREKE